MKFHTFALPKHVWTLALKKVSCIVGLGVILTCDLIDWSMFNKDLTIVIDLCFYSTVVIIPWHWLTTVLVCKLSGFFVNLSLIRQKSHLANMIWHETKWRDFLQRSQYYQLKLSFVKIPAWIIFTHEIHLSDIINLQCGL